MVQLVVREITVLQFCCAGILLLSSSLLIQLLYIKPNIADYDIHQRQFVWVGELGHLLPSLAIHIASTISFGNITPAQVQKKIPPYFQLSNGRFIHCFHRPFIKMSVLCNNSLLAASNEFVLGKFTAHNSHGRKEARLWLPL